MSTINTVTEQLTRAGQAIEHDSFAIIDAEVGMYDYTEAQWPIVRRMILADTPAEEERALEALRVAQRADFLEILEAMDGLPVTI